MDVIAFSPQRQIGINFEARFKNPQKFPETIYARMAELVLGSTPAGTPGVVDGAAGDRRLRQLAAIPSATLAPSCPQTTKQHAINIQDRAQ